MLLLLGLKSIVGLRGIAGFPTGRGDKGNIGLSSSYKILAGDFLKASFSIINY
jgi:hypothetical protein